MKGDPPEKPQRPVPPKLNAMPTKPLMLKPRGQTGASDGSSLLSPGDRSSASRLVVGSPAAQGKAAGILAAKHAAAPGGVARGNTQALLLPKKADVGGTSSPRSSGLAKAGDGASRLSPLAKQRSTLAQKPGLTGARKSLALGGLGGGGGFTTSYFLEKQAIVLNFGHAFTKVGFATECRPRHIIPSPELRQRVRKSEGLVSSIPESEWVDVLDRFLNKVFFHYLCVSPKDRRVIICDAVSFPVAFRDALAFVLFKRFGAPAVAYTAELVLPMYITGLSSGVVIDCGYDCTRIMATFAGVPIFSSYVTAQAGGRHVNALLREALEDEGPQMAGEWVSDESIIEDLKSQVCFVQCDIKGGAESSPVTLKTDQAATFMPRMSGGVTIPAPCRWKPCEAFFGGTDVPAGIDVNDAINGEPGFYMSIQEAFAESLLRMALDVRALVVQNIVVVGGSAMLAGFLPRLAVEIVAELRSRETLRPLADRLLFSSLPFSPITGIWVGGAIYGALEGASEYTAEDYERSRPLPDWCSDGYV